MVVRVTGFSSGAFLQLSRVDGGCIQWLDLNPGPWASWELHATGGIFASAYGSHGVAPPPQVKRQFCFLGHLAGFGTLRFGLPTMGCIFCDREQEKLSFAILLLGCVQFLCGHVCKRPWC